MSTFKTRSFRKTKGNQKFVSEKELRNSKSSGLMSHKLFQTGQLTENSVIFDDFMGEGSGVDVHLSLIYRGLAPVDFNVQNWFVNKSDIMKERIGELMFEIVSNKTVIERFLNLESGSRMVRTITSDIVEGDDKNLIGYFFNIFYTRK